MAEAEPAPAPPEGPAPPEERVAGPPPPLPLPLPLPLLSVHGLGVTLAGARPSWRSPPAEPRAVLAGVTGAFARGEMAAVMGPSGAGKTTFLDAVARRPNASKRAWRRAGECLLAGGPEGPRRLSTRLARRELAYVEQGGADQSVFTVWETLQFAAAFKLGDRPAAERTARCEEVLAGMRLQLVKHSNVGREELGMRGISGGERRRLAVAIAMLGAPTVFLLDEPTSGLDSAMALDVLGLVKAKLQGDQGCTLIVTVHQPSTRLFQLFDSLLLLQLGRPVFWGPAAAALPYFQALGFAYAPGYNTCEFFLETLEAGASSKPAPGGAVAAGPGFFADAFERSALAAQGRRAADRLRAAHEAGRARFGRVPEKFTFHAADSRARLTAAAPPRGAPTGAGGADDDGDAPAAAGGRGAEYKNGPARELYFLLKYRAAKKTTMPWFVLSRVAPVTLVGLIYSSFFADTQVTYMGSMTVSGLLFVSIALTGFLSMGPMEDLKTELPRAHKERRDHYYRAGSYCVEKVLSELPSMVLGAFAFACAVYWAVGLTRTADAFFFFVLVMFVNVLNSTLLVMAVQTNLQMQILPQAFSAIWTCLNMLCTGFFVTRCQIPRWWIWLYYVSYQQWSWSSLMLNEFQGAVYTNPCETGTCSPSPVPGVSIDRLINNLLNPGGGGDTCTFEGSYALESFGIADRDRWTCLLYAALSGPVFATLFYFGVWRTTRR